VEWSHSLLRPAERALLARLSVFTGSFTLEAADAVGAAADPADPAGPAGHPDPLDTLSSLVAQSLVSPADQDAEEPRFRMLDTVRAYARERLAERGERDATVRRLVGWLRDFAWRAGAELEGPDNRAWRLRVDRELADLRAAIRWSIEHDDAESAIRLTAPLFTYWWSRGLLAQQRRVAEEVAALPSASTLPADAAARLVWARGMFRISAGEVQDSEPFLRQLLDAATALGDDRLRAHALTGLGLATAEADIPGARGSLAAAAEIFRRTSDRWGLAFALSGAGQLAVQSGDPAEAAGLHTEALAAAEAIDNDHLRAQVLDLLGLDAIAAGDLAGARSRFAAAAQLHTRLLDQEGSAYCLDGFAAIALAQGRPEVAARLLGASTHAREVVGVAVWPGLRPLAAAMTAAVAQAVGEPGYGLARADGARLRTVDALAYALTATGPAGDVG
jgi:tetratricopeptide (TPR) repeat protein